MALRHPATAGATGPRFSVGELKVDLARRRVVVRDKDWLDEEGGLTFAKCRLYLP